MKLDGEHVSNIMETMCRVIKKQRNLFVTQIKDQKIFPVQFEVSVDKLFRIVQYRTEEESSGEFLFAKSLKAHIGLLLGPKFNPIPVQKRLPLSWRMLLVNVVLLVAGTRLFRPSSKLTPCRQLSFPTLR